MGNDNHDAETGQFETQHPPSDFLEAIDAEGGAAGTQDIADAVGCAYTTAYARLRSLEDADRVESERIANARLWRVADGDE